MSVSSPAAAPPAAAAAVQPGIVRAPAWLIRIEERNVTAEIAPHVRSVTYTDHVHGESDELEIEIADPAGVWRGPWCPEKGNRMDLTIGYLGERMLPCGAFQVDEVEVAGGGGAGDTITIRALAAGHVPALRTRRSHAYEGQPLRQLVSAVAARHHLQVVGEVGDERVERVTQNRESDLAFLTRVAERLGYAFSVRGQQLVFHRIATLEAAPGTFTIARGGVLEYRLKAGSTAVYREAHVSYHDARSRSTVSRTVPAEGVTTGDVLVINSRVEGAEQADQVAAAELRRRNSRGTEGSVSVAGSPLLVAGATGELSGFGRFDGRYTIVTSKHSLTRDAGYTTEIEVRSVGFVEPRKPKHRRSRANRTRQRS